jgi:STE24 endopeptidase
LIGGSCRRLEAAFELPARDWMNEDKSTRYHRLRRRAQLASLAFVATVLAGLTIAGGGVWLRAGSEALVGALPLSEPWARAVVVAAAGAALAIVLEVAALPGACYTGLILDHRYGLSRQSAADWWRDHLKAGLLGVLIAMAVALVVYASMAAWPSSWWLAAGIGLTALAALLALGAPVVLLPVFYRFRPVPPGPLADRLTALATRAGAPVLGVYEWSLGAKSRTANAALVGLGPTRRILLSDTLLAQYTPDEIEVIIAHELAHHVHGDIWKAVGFEAVQSTVALLAGHVVLTAAGPFFGIAGLDDVAGMPLLALVAGGVSAATAPAHLAQSRAHERRADRFALDATSKADAFISAMRRLGDQNLADDHPSRLVEWLFHSHPPLSARIAAARRWALERAPGSAASARVTTDVGVPLAD